MKFLYLTDSHFTAKTPSSRIDDIQDTIKAKLNELKQIIQRENVDVVIHGGDLFHVPDVSNKFVGELAEIFKSFSVPIYVLIGNHDVYAYNSETLHNTKLGLLQKTGVLNILDRTHPVVFDDQGYTIGIEGQEYYGDIDKDSSVDYRVTNLNVDYSILVIHSMLLDHKFFEGIPHTEIKNVVTPADLVLSGHYHPGFKETTVNHTTFLNPGSFLRVDNSPSSYLYTPSVYIIDVNASGMTYKKIPLATAKKADEIFKSKSDKSFYNNSLNEFNKKIKQAQLQGTSIYDLIDSYSKNNNEDSNVVKLVKDSIDAITSDNSVDNGFIPSKDTISITKVEINNFQAHKNKVVNFVDGLNVIRGESNSGKTSVIRSIYWVLYDKPNGADFIRTGAKKVQVSIEFSNGYILERYRTKTSSGGYNLIAPDGEIKEFKGFSNNIPVEISNVHQTPEIKINGTKYKINIASQLDPAFLIGSSPMERVSMIGSLVGAEKADMARKAILSNKKRKATESKQIETLIKEQEIKLDNYRDIEKTEKALRDIECSLEVLSDKEALVKSIVKCKEEMTLAETDLTVIKGKLKSICIPDKALVESLREKLSKLDVMLNTKSLYDNNLLGLETITKSLNNLSDIDKLKNKTSVIRKSYKIYFKLYGLREDLKTQQSFNFDFNFDLDKARLFLDEITEKVNRLDLLGKLIKDLKSQETIDYENTEKILSVDEKIKELTKLKEEKVSKIKEDLSQGKYICDKCGQTIKNLEVF